MLSDCKPRQDSTSVQWKQITLPKLSFTPQLLSFPIALQVTNRTHLEQAS